MGYSDSTVNHFVMYKAGLVSYYGPSVMCEFGEYVSMFEYTKKAVRNVLFDDSRNYQILPSPQLIDLPIFYNVNFGHAMPIGILPYGIMTELYCADKTITLLESATE